MGYLIAQGLTFEMNERGQLEISNVNPNLGGIYDSRFTRVGIWDAIGKIGYGCTSEEAATIILRGQEPLQT